MRMFAALAALSMLAVAVAPSSLAVEKEPTGIEALLAKASEMTGKPIPATLEILTYGDDGSEIISVIPTVELPALLEKYSVDLLESRAVPVDSDIGLGLVDPAGDIGVFAALTLGFTKPSFRSIANGALDCGGVRSKVSTLHTEGIIGLATAAIWLAHDSYEVFFIEQADTTGDQCVQAINFFGIWIVLTVGLGLIEVA